MIRFEESLVRQIEIIKKAANAGKLVLFVGAGVSQNSGIPGWGHLTEELRKDLTGIPPGEYSAQVIAQMYFNKFGKRAYTDKVQRILNTESKQPNPIHNLLFDLNPRHILTTNFDNLIELSAYENQHPFSVVSQDTELPTAEYIQLIIKVHGDFSNGGENIVLKEDDYLSYPRKYPLIKSYIESLFASSVILFIGYGYKDDNLKQIIDQVRVYLGDDSHQAYLIRPEPTDNQIELDYFDKKNIQVISYFDDMWNYLKSGNPHDQPLNIEVNGIEGIGLNLFKILNFISKFDPEVYRLSFENVVNQSLTAIGNLNKQLAFIPPFHLMNIFPFNKGQLKWSYVDDYNYDRSNYSLTTKNSELLSLFAAIKTDKNGHFKGVSSKFIKNILPQKLTPEAEKAFSEKLNSDVSALINALNKNLIYDLPISAAQNTSSGKKRITYKIENQLTDCHSLFFKFQFSKSFEIAYSNNSIKLTAKEYLEHGYTFYQFRDYKRACIEFQNASRIAWKQKLYIIYIIASMNIKRLLKSVDFDRDTTGGDSTKTFIENAINQSGVRHLHETAFSLDVSLTEREIIRYLIEDNMSDSVSNKLRESLFMVRNLSSTYPKSHLSLTYELNSLFVHLNANCIIYDHYTNFKNLARDAFEAYCLNYSKSNPKVQFEIFYLDLALLYIPDQDVDDILSNSLVESIEMAENNISRFIQITNDLLESSYIKGQFGSISPNNFNDDKVMFGFKNRLKEMINTSFVLMARIGIDSSQFEPLTSPILDVIQVMRRIKLKHVSRALFKHQHAFSNGQLESLLKYLLDHDMWAHNFIYSVINILKERDENFKIERADILAKIRSLDFKGEQGLPFLLYKITDIEVKHFIKEVIENRMKETFHEDDYKSAVISDIIEPSLYLSPYLQRILGNTDKRETQLISHFDNPQTIINHWHYRFIIEHLIERLHLENSFQNELNELLEKSDHFSWLYKPEAFNYKNFNKEWLNFERSDWFISRIKNVDILKEKIQEIAETDQDKELAYFFTCHLS